MTTVRLKYVHGFRDRHGKVHYYFRYRGERWRLPAPGTESFATAYDGLLAHIRANPLTCRHNVEFMPGSLGWAIERFLASPLYNERAQTTKQNYRRVLDQLRQSYGTGLLRDLQPRHVRGRYATRLPRPLPQFRIPIAPRSNSLRDRRQWA